MKIPLISIAACCLMAHNIHAQNLLIIPAISYDSFACNVISINKSTIFYIPSDSSETHSLEEKDIASIGLTDSIDLIVTPHIVYDTIRCNVTNINLTDIEYMPEGDNKLHSIPKQEVLACYMNLSCSKTEKLIYVKKFLQFHCKMKRNQRNVLVRQGVKTDPVNNIEMNDKLVFFTPDNSSVRTYITENQVQEIIFAEYTVQSSWFNNYNYILSCSGNIKNHTITGIDGEEILVDVKVNDNIIKSKIDRSATSAIYFGPFNVDFDSKTVEKPQPVKTVERTSHNIRAEIAINGIWGHLFKSPMGEVPDELTSYSRKLRSGYGVAGSFNIFTGAHSSFGLTIKSFNIEREIYDLDISGINSLSDDIRMNFCGLNYQLSSLMKKRVNFDISVSPGLLTFRHDSTVNHLTYVMKGKTFGLNLTSRYNLRLNKSMGLFFDMSFLIGRLKKYTYEGHTMPFESPRQLNHLELGVGIKFSAG